MTPTAIQPSRIRWLFALENFVVSCGKGMTYSYFCGIIKKVKHLKNKTYLGGYIMLPAEIENINRFKSDLPIFLDKVIAKHPLKLKLRRIKKWAIEQINNLDFHKYNSTPEDQIYDATIMCLFETIQINCPVSININKLIKKLKHYSTEEINTEYLYKLVHQDVKKEIYQSNTYQVCPPILLYDDCFGCQLIDGNHRVVSNYRSNQSTTQVVFATGLDLKGCLEFDDFEVIIDVFSKLNSVLKEYD